MGEYICIDILDEITCETLQNILQKIKDIPDGSDVCLNIASYGGEILSTIAMIDALSKYRTHANVLGFACSAAAILALSCTEVSMSEHASLMIHSAWADSCDSDDPGIKRCNELQLSIIKKRCPEYTAEMLITDKWLSAEDCLKLGLTDNINLDDAVTCESYLAIAQKYAAKLDKLYNHGRAIMTEEIKVDEVLEEVKEEDEMKPEEEEPKAEEEPREEPNDSDHDLIEVIEKLTEKVNELECRIKSLEEPADKVEEEPKAEEDDSEAERINNLYKAICKPCAAVPVVACQTKKSVQKVRKGFEAFTKI